MARRVYKMQQKTTTTTPYGNINEHYFENITLTKLHAQEKRWYAQHHNRRKTTTMDRMDPIMLPNLP